MRLAKARRRDDDEATRPSRLRTTERHFYILGSKSFGRDMTFWLSTGHEQIRDLFTILGDREDLDLYASMAKMTGPL